MIPDRPLSPVHGVNAPVNGLVLARPLCCKWSTNGSTRDSVGAVAAILFTACIARHGSKEMVTLSP
ncbi:hypothetical protein DMC47_20460 [Nostoc sp. 3335mG]|nr:hypothetical protein DMC47_20460 [Nostoc sp. 3335mG]